MEGKVEYKVEREIVPCDHVADGSAPIVATVALGANRSVAMCAGCLEPFMRKILGDAALILGNSLLLAYMELASVPQGEEADA